jgi:hypothetical protein
MAGQRKRGSRQSAAGRRLPLEAFWQVRQSCNVDKDSASHRRPAGSPRPSDAPIQCTLKDPICSRLLHPACTFKRATPCLPPRAARTPGPSSALLRAVICMHALSCGVLGTSPGSRHPRRSHQISRRMLGHDAGMASGGAPPAPVWTGMQTSRAREQAKTRAGLSQSVVIKVR